MLCSTYPQCTEPLKEPLDNDWDLKSFLWPTSLTTLYSRKSKRNQTAAVFVCFFFFNSAFGLEKENILCHGNGDIFQPQIVFVLPLISALQHLQHISLRGLAGWIVRFSGPPFRAFSRQCRSSQPVWRRGVSGIQQSGLLQQTQQTLIWTHRWDWPFPSFLVINRFLSPVASKCWWKCSVWTC